MLARTLIRVTSDRDLIAGLRAGRRLARQVGFEGHDLELIATAISEVARNMIAYAGEGALEVGTVEDGDRQGLEVVARVDGPGMSGVGVAMQESRGSMDEFEIEAATGKGTTVTMRKWLSRRRSPPAAG